MNGAYIVAGILSAICLASISSLVYFGLGKKYQAWAMTAPLVITLSGIGAVFAVLVGIAWDQ